MSNLLSPVGTSLKADPTGNALKSLDAEWGIDLDKVIRPSESTRTEYRSGLDIIASSPPDQLPSAPIDPYDPMPFDPTQPHGHYEPDLHMTMDSPAGMPPMSQPSKADRQGEVHMIIAVILLFVSYLLMH